MADDTNRTPEDNAPQTGKPDRAPKKGSDEGAKDRLVKWYTAKKSEYVAEFKRIVWPTREVLINQTVTVVVVSLGFGIYIAILDGAFGFLFSKFAYFTASLFS
jgi:preprotein translocase SecE subunit